MASEQEGLVFGDFNDLSVEEHERVHHILHGQRGTASKKVEFPWDDDWSDVPGAESGPDVVGPGPDWTQQANDFMVDTGFPATGYPANSYPQYAYNQQIGDVPQPQYTADHYRPAMECYDQQHSSVGTRFEVTTDVNSSSRLQASMKPYERRNKKKRPPDYYQMETGDSAQLYEGSNLYNAGVNYNVHPAQSDTQFVCEANVDLSTQAQSYSPHATDTFAATSPAMVLENRRSVSQEHPRYNMDRQYKSPVNPMSGYMDNVVDPGGVNYTQNPSAITDANAIYNVAELNEVVVEPVPHDRAVLPQSETFHIQDHDRTSNFSVDNNSNYKTLQTTNVPPTHISDAFIPDKTAVYGSHMSQNASASINVLNNSSQNPVAIATQIINTVVPQTIPVVPQTIPVVPQTIPVVPQTIPVVPQTIPVVPQTIPVVPQTIPVVPQTIPVVPQTIIVVPQVKPPVSLQNSDPYVSVSNAPIIDTSNTLPDTTSAYPIDSGAQLMSDKNVPVKTPDEKNSIVAVASNAATVAQPTVAMDTTDGSPEAEIVAPPKQRSWAGLFKARSPAEAASNYSTGEKVADSAPRQDPEDRKVKELSPMPVPAAMDGAAKQLGVLLSKMTISHTSMPLQPRGLVNRANWCYINGQSFNPMVARIVFGLVATLNNLTKQQQSFNPGSMGGLQALAACPPFYNLLKTLPKYPALSRGPSSTPILDAMVEFINELQPMSRMSERGGRSRGARDITPGPPFEPSYVYKMLQDLQVNPHFKLGRQEDAEEFLSCILDGMHEEMAAAMHLSDTTYSDITEDEGYTNGYVADGDHNDDYNETNDDWEQVGPKKKSVLTRRANFAKTPMSKIFAGMIRSAVYRASAKETATLEPFFTLQLDIQSESVWSVKDALEGLVSKEPISGYTCAKTNTEVEVVKKLSLEELPPVLILHLKFFVYNKDGGSQKLMKKVDYPVELEITKDILSPNAKNKLNLQQRSYKLFAVVYHHGKTAAGGHYTTAVFQLGINGWVYSDDSSVKPVMVGHVLKYLPPRVPYLLYYRRLDSHLA